MSKDYECPRCGGDIPSREHKGEYPGAASRWDDRSIEVCSACGQDEAMIQFAAYRNGEDQQEAVHPVRGRVVWKTPPATRQGWGAGKTEKEDRMAEINRAAGRLGYRWGLTPEGEYGWVRT